MAIRGQFMPTSLSISAIEAVSLEKTYNTRQGFWKRSTHTTEAVRGISFWVNQGELFGILGPNGAGKTTTVKMLSTLLIPTSGKIHIFGQDIIAHTNEIRKRIGFTFGGARGLYGRLTAEENLRYFAELYALPPKTTRKRIDELLELVNLLERKNDKVETFSSGMQQRLHIARALLHDPEIIFLDEPTVGIDPVGARELRAMVKNLKEHGKTILLTTHYMAEADELCDRIAIINKGKIVALDSPANLKNQMTDDHRVELIVSSEHLLLVKNALSQLGSKEKITYADHAFHTSIIIQTPRLGTVIELLSPLLNNGLIQNLDVRNQTMEDVYVTIIQNEEK